MTRLAAPGAITGTTSVSDTSGDWRHQGECAQIDHLPSGHRMHRHDPDTWYPEGHSGRYREQIAEAKAICGRCPVLETCREDALDNGEKYGIWGGLTEEERASIRRRNGRLRHLAPKPKTPPPAPPPSAKKPRTARPDSDSHCGTLYGYQRHRERKDAQGRTEEACDPCKAAKATDSADRRRAAKRGGQAA